MELLSMMLLRSVHCSKLAMASLVALMAVGTATPQSMPQSTPQIMHQTGTDELYGWLRPRPRLDCTALPDREKLKFGCKLSFLLGNPDASRPTLLPDEGQWAWLTTVKAAECRTLPEREIEKFEECETGPGTDPAVEARNLVDRLTDTRAQLERHVSSLERRRATVASMAASLATVEQQRVLADREAQLEHLRRMLERHELVDAFTRSLETAHKPAGDMPHEPELNFARLRVAAEVFPGPERDARSVASLERDSLILMIGDRVTNARHLIFARGLGFGYVSAPSLRADEAKKE